MSQNAPDLDLDSLRAAYAAGALTPEALIEQLYASYEQSSREHPNAFIHRAPKASVLEQARALGDFDASQPLWGVPFAVKDNIDVEGMPTTAACPAFSYMPARSAPVVEKLLAAGALCLGKTNLDQFATGLVGTRSPYGACRNAFNTEYLSGGSSSGSAVAVTVGQVSFALGTDTAGSGRVPAAFGNIVGLKPTRGLLSTVGVVPACASLDCVSVFALRSGDGARVREVMQGTSAIADVCPASLTGTRLGVPDKLEFFGDAGAAEVFASALETLEARGATLAKIDWSPFEQIGNLLYGGPWVAERTLAVGSFIRKQPDDCLAVTRAIISGGERYNAMDVFRAQATLASLIPAARAVLGSVDALLLPTTPTLYTIEQEQSDHALNDRLGIYTRFANFISAPALAVPAGFTAKGLPFGVTLVMSEGEDRALDALGVAVEGALGFGMGLRKTLPAREGSHNTYGPALPGYVRLAVVGAHLRGQPLNRELTSARARFVRETRTDATYRLYVLAGTVPLKPGMQRMASGEGANIAIELWDMPVAAFGAFVAKIPPPLAIGTLRCEDGELIKGFLCETHALQSAEDISHHGGFLAYLAQAKRPS